MSSMDQQSFKLDINQFLTRFRNSKKLDDLFSRGYTICNDSLTNNRVILKFYAVETVDQEQAVLQSRRLIYICVDLMNFAKLNQIQGICKLIAYAIAESGTQLISAFQYDPMTLGEYVKAVKESGVSRAQRQLMYIQLIRQILKVIVTGVQIGIELDDINRQTILIKQSPLFPQQSSSSSLSASIQHVINIFYDQRQKQYTRLESAQLSLSPPSSASLSPSSSTSNNNNKIYWSLQKIQNQILKNHEYSTSQGQQSIYQLGLMMMDIIYEIEKHYQMVGSQSIRDQQQLRPDQIAIHSENVLSYYQIDGAQRKVQRNQMLISHRLNYLVNTNNQINKELCVLMKNMIILIPETRISINRLNSQLERIHQMYKYFVSVGKADTPLRGLQKNTQSLRSIDSCQQQVVHFPSTETLKIVEQLPKFPSNDNIDSLKYSENSIGNNYHDTFKFSTSSTNTHPQNFLNSQQSPSIPKETSSFAQPKQFSVHPQSATTITSDNTNSANFKKIMSGYTSTQIPNNGINSRMGSGFSREQSSPNVNLNANPNQEMKGEDIIGFWKGSHQDLKMQLRNTIAKIQQIKKKNPNAIIKKQYVDKSLYYGCVNPSSKRQGLGIYIYKTGDIYFGNWKQNSLTNGTYLFKNGQSFQGLVKNGKQGHGIYRYSNGNIYDGQWKDDLKNGNGSMRYPTGAKYEGEWVKGKKHGNGIYYYENGIQYNGGFALGKKYGNGIFTFPGGTRVQGFWDNNHLQGLCRIYYKNGDYYQGNIHMSQKSGEGLYQWNNNQQIQVQYKGQFSKDNLDGFAIVKFKNKQVYQGRIRNGKRDGQGIYRYNNGDQFHGQWKNDDKKIGKYIFSTGDVFEGNFKNGQMAFGVMKYQNGEIYEGDFYRGERHGVGTYSNKIGQLVYQGKWERDQYIGPNKNQH